MENYWIAINCTLRLILTVMMVVGIVRFEHWWSQGEKFGMGIIGGSIFLTIPVIIAAGKEKTPFDNWASSLTAMGFVIFFFFMLRRKWRHDTRNDLASRQAHSHLVSRGKI